jgi:tRNA(Ile)-lysidine synthase
LRPLLDVARGDLRHHADTLHLPYVDDPSNDDPRFDRVRVRAALEHLSDLGITPEGLARTAHRMGRARVALAARAADIADRIQIAEPRITGHVLLDRDGFAPVERDTQLRLLAAALQLVTGAPYRPRAAALEALLDRIAGGRWRHALGRARTAVHHLGRTFHRRPGRRQHVRMLLKTMSASRPAGAVGLPQRGCRC